MLRISIQSYSVYWLRVVLDAAPTLTGVTITFSDTSSLSRTHDQFDDGASGSLEELNAERIAANPDLLNLMAGARQQRGLPPLADVPSATSRSFLS